jgi:hypothetical protein
MIKAQSDKIHESLVYISVELLIIIVLLVAGYLL